jgi:biotin-dependent carboxylase-like uncharacterized protein
LETLRILAPGPLATVQDGGRFAYQDRGVPVSGAMDLEALRIGNWLVGNRAGEAALEITWGGFAAEFLNFARFAVTGADLGGQLNQRPVDGWRCFTAAAGDVLTLDQAGTGWRGYLCLAGGFEVPLVMGSKSTYVRGAFGGYRGRSLQSGDVLACGEALGRPVSTWPAGLIPQYSDHPVLRVLLGPQEDLIAPQGLEAFLNSAYVVTERCDRMGCVLRGPAIRHWQGADIISDGTVGGAVQVPGNGQPIILLADRQTVGGYVKIATVASVDLPLLAQIRPGCSVRFATIDLLEAREIHLKHEYLLLRAREQG